jgi:hypothetical protein
MNINNKKKVIAINAILFAALFGLVSLNKEILRPALDNSSILKILTGCFPNFIAAYFISLAFVSAVLIRKFKHGRLIVYSGSIAVFVILTIEELKPMWGASTYYDIFDIIASGVGSTLAIFTYELLILIKMKKSIHRIIMLILLIMIHFSCENKDNEDPPKNELSYDTIFPKYYLPVYPGSYWKYLDEKEDTVISQTSDYYILDYYEYPVAGYISDSFFVPVLDNVPIWGYEAHSGPISHAGSYPFTLILNDTSNIGYNWQIAYWAGNENRRIIIAKDTIIQLSTSFKFDSVIVVKEYQSQPENVPEWWYKRYYAKYVGMIKEEYWFSYDSTYNKKELFEYFINR